MRDLEELMDSMFELLKVKMPLRLNLLSAEKEDRLLDGWALSDNAYFIDSFTNDLPPYKSSLLLFIASGPTVDARPEYEAIQTYTLCITVLLADDMKDNFFRVKKRFSRVIKDVVLKDFTKEYRTNDVTFVRAKDDIVISPNGTQYQVCLVYFDVTFID